MSTSFSVAPEKLFTRVEYDGASYLIFNKLLNFTRPYPVTLSFPEMTLILLSPIKANKGMTIRAKNYIGLSSLTAEEGVITIVTTGNAYSIGETVKSLYERVIHVGKDNEKLILSTSPELSERIANQFREALASKNRDLFTLACNSVCEMVEAFYQGDASLP